MSSPSRPTSDWFGAVIGFITFVGGIGLLLLTFKLAYDMFAIPPDQALGLQKAQALDVARASESLASIVTRMLLLLVMAAVGSLTANRGIRMYVSSRSIPPTPPPVVELEKGHEPI